jgi:phage tail-like protein
MPDEAVESRYLALLPELMREGAAQDRAPAIVGLLRIIEELLGGFQTTLDAITDLVVPASTPEEFLPWLASWVALVLRTDWDVSKQRAVLAQIIPLYRMRGTKEGLEAYLAIYVGSGITIKDELGPFQIDEHSTIGEDTFLNTVPLQINKHSTVGDDMIIGGVSPYLFLVNIPLPTPDEKELKRAAREVEAVLDIEKPAHTFYQLNFSIPTFQINEHSTVGIDTLI